MTGTRNKRVPSGAQLRTYLHDSESPVLMFMWHHVHQAGPRALTKLTAAADRQQKRQRPERTPRQR